VGARAPGSTVTGRLRARAEVDAAIAAFARTRSAMEVADAIAGAGAIAAPIVDAPSHLGSPQLQSRGWFQTVTHRYAGTRIMPGFLWSIAQDPPSWDRPSGLVGEHLDEVFAELGYTQAEIAAFERAGVIGRGYALPS
jgi:formyl-CoA transferase